jgi:hypothetical protein
MVFDSSLIRGLMDPIPNYANGVPSLLAGKRNTKQEKTFLGDGSRFWLKINDLNGLRQDIF